MVVQVHGHVHGQAEELQGSSGQAGKGVEAWYMPARGMQLVVLVKSHARPH